MAPKAKKGKGESKSSARPAWISEEVWVLRNNPPAMVDNLRGIATGDSPLVPKSVVAYMLWQQLFAPNTAAQDLQAEILKLGGIEVLLKMVAGGHAVDMTPALGVLHTFARTDVGRAALLDARPSLMPLLLEGLHVGSPSLTGACIALIRTLAEAPDSRQRLMRAMKDWPSWRPITEAMFLEDQMPLCGGRQASFDAVAAVAALVAEPPEVPDTPKPAKKGAGGGGGKDVAPEIIFGKLAEANTMKGLLAVCRCRDSLPAAKAAAVGTIYALMFRGPESFAEAFVEGGGIIPIAEVLSSPLIPLPAKALAAGVLKLFIVYRKRPETDISKAISVPTEHPPARLSLASVISITASSAGMSVTRPGTVQSVAGTALPDGVAPGLPPTATAISAPEARPTTAAPTAGARPTTAVAAPDARRPTTAAAGAGAPAPAKQPPAPHWWLQAMLAEDGERLLLEEELLDEPHKEQVMQKVHMIARVPGAIPTLVGLCSGPEGPLPELTQSSAEGDSGAKGKGKKAAKKKAGKLEPGMAEAQVHAAGCLRLMSLSDSTKRDIMAAGAVRYLTPLLDSKLNHARWHARQTLLNLAMRPEYVEPMTRYQVPAYIHGANVPKPPAFSRPITAPATLFRQLSSRGGAMAGGPAGVRDNRTAPAGYRSTGLGETEPPQGLPRAPSIMSHVGAAMAAEAGASPGPRSPSVTSIAGGTEGPAGLRTIEAPRAENVPRDGGEKRNVPVPPRGNSPQQTQDRERSKLSRTSTIDSQTQ